MINPTNHMLAPAILSTLACCRWTPLPYITTAKQQAPQGHYVNDEKCIHTPANMIKHYLGNNYATLLIHYILNTLRRFPCGGNLNNNSYFYCCVGEKHTEKHPITPDQTVIIYSLMYYY